MPRFLHIDASPRTVRSRSRNVTEAFTEALRAHKSDVEIVHLPLWDMDLPELGGGMIEGRYNLIVGEDVPAEISAAWENVGRYAREFLNHDGYIFSVPMWNFGIPYKLKHYIDVITQPRALFVNDAEGNVEGKAAGKTAIIIAASAMPIGQIPDLNIYDFQQRYLEMWLGFIGIEDIRTLRAAPTYGEHEAVEAVMAQARADARALAQTL